MDIQKAQDALRARYVANMQANLEGKTDHGDWIAEIERIADDAYHASCQLKLQGLDRLDFIRAICAPTA
jgi:hypothetical protein